MYTATLQVIGKIWMPSMMAAQTLQFGKHEIDNMRDDDGNITRESVELFANTHIQDFKTITDFRLEAIAGQSRITIEWHDANSEFEHMALHGLEETDF